MYLQVAVVRPRKFTHLHKHFVELRAVNNSDTVDAVKVIASGFASNKEAKKFALGYAKTQHHPHIVYANGRRALI